MAIPTYVSAAGATGVGAISPPWGAGHQANDIGIMLVETANEAITLTDAQGFVEVTNSPQGVGTAGAAAASRLAMYWCRATSSAMTAPTIADSGDHTAATIFVFRGCVQSGDPWSGTPAGHTDSSVQNKTFDAVTTTINDCLVLNAVSRNNDLAGGYFASWTNASLANITEIYDNGWIDGNGGGYALCSGELATAGSSGGTTVTATAAVYGGLLTIALAPPSPIYTGSGGAIGGGTGILNRGLVFTGTGGALGGGAGTKITSKLFVGTGGAIGGGAGQVLLGNSAEYVGSGGAIGGGAGVRNTDKLFTGAGGAIGGGAGAFSFTLAANLEPIIWGLFDTSGNAITAATPTITIMREADQYLFDFADSTFKASGWTTVAATMSTIDATNLPGYYKQVINVATFNNGRYDVFTTYSSTPKQNSSQEFYIDDGQLVDEYIADKVDLINTNVNTANTNISTISTNVSTINTNTDTIESRLPTALVDGRIVADIRAVKGIAVGGSGTVANPWGPA